MTPKQEECLKAIRRLTVGGVSPSYDELREALGLTSKSGVHRLVHGLAERGHIVINYGKRRSIGMAPKKLAGVPFDRMTDAVMAHLEHRQAFGLKADRDVVRSALIAACAREVQA